MATDLIRSEDLNSALADDLVTRGTAAAGIVSDLVIRSDEDDSQATDYGKAIRAAQKALDAKKKEITRPINDALARVRAMFKPFEDQLAAALTTLDRKQLAWKQEQRRRAEEELRRQQAEAEEAAKKAAEEAEVFGEEAPPAAVAHVVEPPRISRGAAGSSAFTRQVPHATLRTFHDADPAWFDFSESRAWASLRAAAERGDALLPTLGHPVRWQGVEFSVEETLVRR